MSRSQPLQYMTRHVISRASRLKLAFVRTSGPYDTQKKALGKANHMRTINCLVAEHCWDPVSLAIGEYRHRFEHLPRALLERR